MNTMMHQPPSIPQENYQSIVCTKQLSQNFPLQELSRNDTDPQSNHLQPFHRLHPVATVKGVNHTVSHQQNMEVENSMDE